mgnify:CR=1 FL=1
MSALFQTQNGYFQTDNINMFVPCHVDYNYWIAPHYSLN